MPIFDRHASAPRLSDFYHQPNPSYAEFFAKGWIDDPIATGFCISIILTMILYSIVQCATGRVTNKTVIMAAGGFVSICLYTLFVQSMIINDAKTFAKERFQLVLEMQSEEYLEWYILAAPTDMESIVLATDTLVRMQKKEGKVTNNEPPLTVQN